MRRYLNYPEADFEVFRPAGATRCTDGGEIWHWGCQISPPSVQGIGTPKLKFLLRFDQNVEYKHPTGVYLYRNFHKICWVCTPFQDALAVKIFPKNSKFAQNRGLWHGHWKPTQWTHADEIWHVVVGVCSSTPDLTTSLKGVVQECPKCQVLPKIVFLATGSRHSEHIHMKFGE